MLRLISEMYGYSIRATDADMGRVHDFYFDDKCWTTRYLIADTARWLAGRLVLISPASLGEPDWTARVFPVNLTKEQVEKSPDISEDMAFSRQHEIELAKYYSWPTYWGAVSAGWTAQSSASEAGKMADPVEDGDPHLRSTREVMGYHIQALDGDIGHVEDFIVEDESWILRYIVVDTRNWLPGKKVLVSPTWINQMSWSLRKVVVDLPKEKIKDAPPFDPSVPMNRRYETVLYDFYGRPDYWSQVG